MRQQFTNDTELNSRVRSWWNANPFNYFVNIEEGSWEFYREIDRKFLKWIPFMQTGPQHPFLTRYVDMHGLKGKKLLDIACGTGVLTEQFVRMGAVVTAIDLTPKAVELTKKRLALYGLTADVMEADAQKLPFEDNTFDYVCAWGCLMHMPMTEQAISEIHRVLKPGGKSIAMMYHRDSVHLRYCIQLGRGILRLKYLKYDDQSLINRYTDGASVGGNMLARFYTRKQFYALFNAFKDVRLFIHDNHGVPDQLPHPWLPLGKLLPKCVKEWICRTFGMTAIITMTK
ncbi:MAG: class I SAM-dependent methyltransferase [Candidatus Peribacteraceae bacterium]